MTLTEKFSRAAKRSFYRHCTRLQFNFMMALSRGDMKIVEATVNLFPEAVHWRGGKGREGDYLDNNTLQVALLGQAGKSAELLCFLLARGVDVNQQDWRGNTALHRAAYMKDRKAMSVLLRHGADPAIANHAGETTRDALRNGCKFLHEDEQYFDQIDRERAAYVAFHTATTLQACTSGTQKAVPVRNRPLKLKKSKITY